MDFHSTAMRATLLLLTLPAFADVPLKDQSVVQLEQRLNAIDAELAQLAHYSLRSGVGAIGYRSRGYSQAEDTAWVEIQLGGDMPLDELMLVPAVWRDTEMGFLSDGFPEAFRVLAGRTDEREGTLLAEITTNDAILPRIAPLVIPTSGITASWVRVESTRMSPRAFDGKFVLQFAEVLAFSGQENMALHQAVTTSSNRWDGALAWDPRYLTDGFVPYLMNSGQGRQSTAYLSPFDPEKPTDDGVRLYLSIDLQQTHPVSRIHVHAVDQGDTVPQAAADGIGMPYHFLIEGATQADFSDRIVLLDIRRESPYDTAPIMMWNLPEASCRYVRLTALEPYLYQKDLGRNPRIGFAEIEVFSHGVNVARDKPVSTSFWTETDETRPLTAPTDGHNLYGSILPVRDWLNQLARRHDLETERPRIAAELNQRYARQKINLRRMGGLAALLAAGIGFTFLFDRMIRMRQVARIKERFAADLHDELGANLHTIGLLSDLAEVTKDTPDELAMLHQRIRDVTERTGLAVRHCTNMLEANGLYLGLKTDMERASQRILAKLDHTITVEGERHLDQLTERTRADLFLFYKESLVNISRHADATEFTTRLIADSRNIHLTIDDNGRGIGDVPKNEIPASLQRRARLLGARVAINSPPSGGTHIDLRLKTRSWGRRK